MAIVALLLSLLVYSVRSEWIDYPSQGQASLTHYQIPRDYVASCGCAPSSTHYPTAALSQFAYGSNTSYGPACGKCFKLTLIDPVVANPPFTPSVTKSIVVKITDLCPFSAESWCGGTPSEPNAAGAFLNFDLAFPSRAIPDNFFPSDEALYGYKDFGVWNVKYETVSCNVDWAGRHDNTALGSVAALGDGACCPIDPTGGVNDTCPSYSDKNGIPPNTANASHSVEIPDYLVQFLGLIISCMFWY
ncbi:hypothetical protein AMATHDRAFT_187285 [Amanita thiersii Skay4041]|uniref:Expansin-like EG45 domain-containing protein n=1 Tax=Amanita thiersii Skay4041 TaxID=703135 RepID=A0A2A9P0F5_9AGAR|nr:hypothetical protein AMATHDRAFT_187285 [Amanita thiersii Skay4041]